MIKSSYPMVTQSFHCGHLPLLNTHTLLGMLVRYVDGVRCLPPVTQCTDCYEPTFAIVADAEFWKKRPIIVRSSTMFILMQVKLSSNCECKWCSFASISSIAERISCISSSVLELLGFMGGISRQGSSVEPAAASCGSCSKGVFISLCGRCFSIQRLKRCL